MPYGRRFSTRFLSHFYLALSIVVFLLRFHAIRTPIASLHDNALARRKFNLNPQTNPSHNASLGTFTWKDVPAKYPIEITAQLPTEEPLELPNIQAEPPQLTKEELGTQIKRREEVKTVFLKCWNSYKVHAWGHDELLPVSGGYADDYGGWGATLIDSLSTLWIMGLEQEYASAVHTAVRTSFTPTGFKGTFVNVFETIIRYLGGLLSAYDLSGNTDARLLTKAIEVGDLALAAFDTPNHMPQFYWEIANFASNQTAPEVASLAGLGSFTVEFTRLSQLTGDMRYFDTAQRIAKLLDAQQNLTHLPGMFPETVNLRTANLTQGTTFTLGANSDSTYEYFAKVYQLLGGRSPVHRKLYEASMDAAIKYLLFKPKTHDNADILVAGDWHSDTRTLEPRCQHLASFAAGMFMLGGRLFDRPDYVAIGLKLADGCAWVYQNSPAGIMPETFAMHLCPADASDCHLDPSAQAIIPSTNGRYMLRPEAIEALFYAWRVSGDGTYQDLAWNMFETVNNLTSTDLANAELADVMLEHPCRVDRMESFWLAETLKYFFLMFSDFELVSLDEWVFNTEAHPLRVPRRGKRWWRRWLEVEWLELSL